MVQCSEPLHHDSQSHEPPARDNARPLIPTTEPRAGSVPWVAWPPLWAAMRILPTRNPTLARHPPHLGNIPRYSFHTPTSPRN